MGFSKYSMLVLLALAFIAVLWVFGGSVFRGATKWLLWALGALCACAGVLVLVDAKGKALPILGGFVLLVFAAHSIKVSGSLRKRN